MRRFLVIAFATTFLVSAEASPADVKLNLGAGETLPSISVEYSIVVTNESLAPVTIPGCIWMTAKARTGPWFTLVPVQGLSDPCVAVSPEKQVVDAGGRVEFVFELLDVPSLPFLQDPRLHSTGEYDLRAILSEADEPPTWNSAFASNDARLEVRFLSDDDAKAWMWMNEVSDEWSNLKWVTQIFRIGPDLVARFPNSNYVPYVLRAYPGMEQAEKNKLIEHAIAAFPHSQYRSQLMMYLALSHQRQFRDLLAGNHLEDATIELNLARDWASRAAQGESPATRRRAAETLQELPEARDLRQSPDDH